MKYVLATTLKFEIEPGDEMPAEDGHEFEFHAHVAGSVDNADFDVQAKILMKEIADQIIKTFK
jgi:hypothetical protein